MTEEQYAIASKYIEMNEKLVLEVREDNPEKALIKMQELREKFPNAISIRLGSGKFEAFYSGSYDTYEYTAVAAIITVPKKETAIFEELKKVKRDKTVEVNDLAWKIEKYQRLQREVDELNSLLS